jgi:hypothetical protein
MIDGKEVRISGVDYIVPPLNFKQLKALKGDIAILSAGGTSDEEQFDAVVRICHAALSRNYPDITKERLEEMLDLSNFGKIASAVLGSSGFEKQESGKEAPRGN